MKKRLISGLLVAMLASSGAYAFEPFVVKDIRVEGIQRTEAGTVFSYLPVKVGETFDEDKAAQAIRALFATGFFKDVRIEVENGILVVVVDERPAIATIEFTGIKEFDKDQLKKGLREIGLSESRIFDRAMLDKAEQELKRQYLSRGRYAIDVKTTVTPLERNRVAINFTVNEGEVAKIRQINLIGISAFKEKDLLKLFSLTTPGWLTWYTKNDQYSRQKLQGDLETLRSYYLNQGYLEFNVESTQVQISPDKRDIYITINVVEGEKYTISSVKLAGELLVPEDELRKLVRIKPGDVYSRERLTETTKAISDRLGNDGYAFANVNAAPEIDKEKRQAAFTVFVDPGRRVYVRRVNVSGNTRTRDEVVRRETRQMEGAWYDGERINKSRQRVDRIGFFEDVTVETPAVPGTTDQVDVNISVKEKPTGSLLFGAGFSSSEKLILTGSISQNNLFGSGNALTLNANTSKVNRNIGLSYNNPYYTVDGISRGFNIYQRNVDPTSLSIGQYKSSSLGGGVSYGFPIGDDDSISVGLSYDRTSIDILDDSPQRYKDFVEKFGDSNTTLLASAGWATDRRDSFIYPTRGNMHRLFGEMSLPGGNLRFFKINYQYQHFFPLSQMFTLALNTEVGLGNGYGGQDLPFYKNFFAGGIGSVRGFESSSIGPRDAVTDESIGGNRRAVGSLELLFPLPGAGYDKSLRLGWFLDAGQVWEKGEKIKPGDMRFSTGLSVAWSSPLGPLKFSFGQPFNKKPEDRVQRFQFQLGTAF
jgi:outer membrane protein insertion porin family